MPRKTDDVVLTRRIVKTILREGPMPVTKLARKVGTTSTKKVEQIANILSSGVLAMSEDTIERAKMSNVPVQAIKSLIMVPDIIELKDAPDVVTMEPLPVHEAKFGITSEVIDAVTESGTIPPAVIGRKLKVELSEQLETEAKAQAIKLSSKK